MVARSDLEKLKLDVYARSAIVVFNIAWKKMFDIRTHRIANSNEYPIRTHGQADNECLKITCLYHNDVR